MNNGERIAKLKRSLAELRSRFIRIEGESFAAARQITEIEEELLKLEASEVRA